MTKNRLLRIAFLTCKVLRLIYIAIFLLLTGLFAHYQISPSSYEEVDFNPSAIGSSVFIKKLSSYKIHVDGKLPEDAEVFAFNKLKYTSLYFNYIKLSVVLLFGFLCIKEFQAVIESVQGIKTFQKRNVSAFRRIGKYVLVIFVLTSYSSYTFQQGGISGLHFSFELLILSLLAYIMAEIFMEGNKLSEENELTV